MMCQACWDEAYLIAELRGVPQADVYNELIRSRPVTFHEKKCALSREVTEQEVPSEPNVRAQTKRRTKGKSKWRS